MMDGWTFGVCMLLMGVLIVLRKRQRRAAEREETVDQAGSNTAPRVVQDQPSPEDLHWPVDTTLAIRRDPKSVRFVISARGFRSGRRLRCTACELGGQPAVEVIEVTPDGEDRGEPKYLNGYSMERAIEELTG